MRDFDGFDMFICYELRALESKMLSLGTYVFGICAFGIWVGTPLHNCAVKHSG